MVGVGVLLNFGIHSGAIGSTVAHDSHNIIVAGDNDRDILVVVKELERIQGGYVIARDGEVVASFQLKILGLMTDKSYDEVKR
eukprot:gnl/Chilomastix_caulleri/3081.p1 GENE.gnl/Chilomastix_caulleri/3081~~gnl/Chilomastix_caulleri/3081.p1  ORF type:complete len:83 (+),score=25.05 gnl/Chilomastix_caulleri/3081:271-519(+)